MTMSSNENRQDFQLENLRMYEEDSEGVEPNKRVKFTVELENVDHDDHIVSELSYFPSFSLPDGADLSSTEPVDLPMLISSDNHGFNDMRAFNHQIGVSLPLDMIPSMSFYPSDLILHHQIPQELYQQFPGEPISSHPEPFKELTDSHKHLQDLAKDGANLHDLKWEQMFDLLLQVEVQFGSCKLPLSYQVLTTDNQIVRIGSWLGTQRQLYRKGQLRADKLARLQALVDADRFEWGEKKASADEERWNRCFALLLQFQEKFGHCNVPERYVVTSVAGEEKISLGKWVNRQRKNMNSKKLRSDRLEQFQTLVKRNLLIPNTAEEDEKRWNLHYYCLLEYGQERGTCNVPYNYTIQSPGVQSRIPENIIKLGVWLSTQRNLYKSGNKLRSDRFQKLQELVDRGLLRWGEYQIGNDKKWDLRFEVLLRFQDENQHFLIPEAYEACLSDGTKVKLFKWILRQLMNLKNGKLDESRKNKILETIEEREMKLVLSSGEVLSFELTNFGTVMLCKENIQLTDKDPVESQQMISKDVLYQYYRVDDDSDDDEHVDFNFK